MTPVAGLETAQAQSRGLGLGHPISLTQPVFNNVNLVSQLNN